MRAVVFLIQAFFLVAALAHPGLAADAPSKAAARIEPKMTDDGLLTQEWFLSSFLVLPEDLAEATKHKKRLAIVWEQKGCPYCLDMHKINLADPALNRWIRERFEIIQLNLWGDREVTDFDGQVLPEKELARKYRIQFTPTIQFFPESIKDMQGKKGVDGEVARMPGYFRPFHFSAMFEYVVEKRYERQDFQRYILEKSEKSRAP